MNSLDIILGILLTVFIFIGIWKGFFREVLGLLGVIGGVFLAIVGFGPVSQTMNRLLPGLPAFILPFFSFIFIFLAVYISTRLLANLLSTLSQKIYLGWLNRILGGIIGGLKGALLISLLLLLIGLLPFQNALHNARSSSLLFTPLQNFIPAVYDLGEGFHISKTNFQGKITGTLRDAKVKLSDEMIKYLFDGKKDTSDSKR